MEHLDHPSPPPFQCCQNGAFLLLRAFIIALAGGGRGLIVAFYSVQDCSYFRFWGIKVCFSLTVQAVMSSLMIEIMFV